jgi:PIN domain nuclease of toxin-antitoxin system
MTSTHFLLDTHVLVWWVEGQKNFSDSTKQMLDNAHILWVSPVSFWEVGLLHNKNRLHLSWPFNDWVRKSLTAPCIRECPFDSQIAAESTQLFYGAHHDPADRFLMATARVMNLPIVTRDRRIIAHGEQGFLRVIAV